MNGTTDVNNSDARCVGDLRKLPHSTVKVITSSQVITSVYSVVKELIENALDAKATSIDIKLDNYGFDKIEVRDNGCGIKAADTPYMAQSHYTSKIQNIQDLNDLETYGFRGEALGCLCSLANVSITTKTADDPVSMTYTLSQEGKIMDTKPSHLGQGTTVTVTDLFRNLPVRRQFYNNKKKQKDEMKKIEDLVTVCAIIAYDVRFCLKHNNNIIWQKHPMADVRSVLILVFGVNIMTFMEHIKKKCLDTKVEVETFLPKSSCPSDAVTRSTADRLFCYINRRPVFMKDIEKLIRKSYIDSAGCDSSRYPIGFLHITLPYKHIDVNVEPNKTQVLLQNKDKVLKFLSSVLEEIYSAREKKASSNNKTVSDVSGDETLGNKQDPTVEEQLEDTIQSHHPAVAEQLDEVIPPQPPTVQNQLCQKTAAVHTVANGQANDIKNEQAHNNILDISDASGLHLPEVPKLSSQTEQSTTTNPDTVDTLQDIDITDADLTEELLKDFDEEVDLRSDISTPEQPSAFAPQQTSTQAQSSDGSTSPMSTPPLDESAALKWALGRAVVNGDGEVVEPVQVLEGRPLTEEKKISEPDKSKNESGKSISDKTFTSFNQASLFDVSIKKPGSGYLYYSKEIRRKVVAENPGATFAEIGKIIVEKWKALSDEEKQKYEDLVVREELWNKYETSMKASRRQSELPQRESCGPTSKKAKLNQSELEIIVQKRFTSSSCKDHSEPKSARNEAVIKFSVTDLRNVLNRSSSQSQSQAATRCMTLVGQLESQCAWVCFHNDSLKLFQPIRAKEEILYRRLMANHKFVTEPLDSPQPLTENNLSPDLYQTLLSLKTSPLKPTDPYCYVTDCRIQNNGFRIRHRTDAVTKQPVVELVGMTTTINGFDVKVLMEILKIINRYCNVLLPECRPQIVKQYLQSEAVRMSRQLPAVMSAEVVHGLVGDMQCHLAGGTKTCFHGRPILYDLFDLRRLPDDSQRSELA